jgi:hypothetical protein
VRGNELAISISGSAIGMAAKLIVDTRHMPASRLAPGRCALGLEAS